MVDLPLTVDPDDALSQATRAQLFALLGELKRPVTTAELAERLALHPNGIRLHLERLREAGLVERASVPLGRGRPPDLWTIAPGARPGGEPPHAYQDLGRWLARAIRAWPSGTRSIEKTGRRIGRELGPQSAGVDGMQTALTALGFQPIVQREGDQVRICLGNCPYRDAVHENQAAVCALHKGMTRGLLDVLEPKTKLVAFVPHDPDTAGCVIQLRGVAEE